MVKVKANGLQGQGEGQTSSRSGQGHDCLSSGRPRGGRESSITHPIPDSHHLAFSIS